MRGVGAATVTPSWLSHFRRRRGAAAAVETAGRGRVPRRPLVKRRGIENSRVELCPCCVMAQVDLPFGLHRLEAWYSRAARWQHAGQT